MSSTNVGLFWRDRPSALGAIRAILRPGGLLATTYQPRHSGAQSSDAFRFAEQLKNLMGTLGFIDTRTKKLDLQPHTGHMRAGQARGVANATLSAIVGRTMAMNRTERRRQIKDDEQKLKGGIDADSSDPAGTAAMTRLMSDFLETAKRDRNIEPPVKFLHAKVDATLHAMRNLRVDCKKGCAHCCRVWVSATIPEVLFIAKSLRRRNDVALTERVGAAHRITGAYDFVSRQGLHQQCPLLADDLCSVYETRPVSCRFWASTNVAACLRVFRQSSGERVPTPMSHLKGRGAYEIALSLALKHVGLPHYYYELNAALARALERSDAEFAWLGGEDVFFDVRRDPHDVSTDTVSRQLYKFAFA